MKANADYDTFSAEQNALDLLKALKSATFEYDHRKDHYVSLGEAIEKFWKFFQPKEMSNSTFLDKFKSLVKIVEHHGGNIDEHEGLMEKETPDGANDDARNLAKQTSKEKFLARQFIRKADRSRYGRLVEELHN
eukprot:7688390-Ditylum_brightwellii.AAC.1